MTATLHPHPGHADTAYVLPNYALRRLMVAVIAMALLVMAAIAVVETVGALVDLGGRPAAASEIPAPGSASAPSLHVAAPGDTLWSIAEQYRGAVSRDRYVDALIDLNGGTSIQAGQPVRLP
jgi:hypothetical protein